MTGWRGAGLTSATKQKGHRVSGGPFRYRTATGD